MNYEIDEDIEVINKDYNGDDPSYRHPSYGMISIHRTLGGTEEPLFGSEVGSSTKMRIELKQAEITQHLGRNWFYSYESICRVEMSPVQFAELITCPNTEGMPCTINYVRDCGLIKYKGIGTQTQYVESQLETEVSTLKNKVSTINSEVKGIIGKSGTLKKADKEKILSLVSSLVSILNSGIPFYEESLKESVDKLKSEARTEMDAYITHAIHKAGIEAINEKGGLSSNTKLLNRAGEN